MPRKLRYCLTDRLCRQAKPKEKPYDISDGCGLVLRIAPNGGKFWALRIRINGKMSRISLGEYRNDGRGVSLDEARERAVEARAQAEAGVHINKSKRESLAARKREERAQRESRFEFVVSQFLTDKAAQVTPKTAAAMEGAFERHLLPHLADKSIEEINYLDVKAILQAVGEERTNIGAPKTYMARKLCTYLAQVFEYYTDLHNGARLPNMRTLVKYLPKHKVQHMQRIPIADLPDFARKLLEYHGIDTVNTVQKAIWLMLMTGQRTASIRRALWKDMDLKAGKWTRPPEKAHNHSLDIPLPRQAVEMLRVLEKEKEPEPEDLVFTLTGRMMSDMTVNNALSRMGYDGKMTGHGIRALVNTALKERGYPPMLIEIQLDHAVGTQISRAYGDDVLSRYPERQKMMQEWADALEKMTGGT